MSFIIYFGLIIGIILLIRYIVEKIRLDQLYKRPVLITGCDSGFGYELTLKCLSAGMPVFATCLTDRGTESLQVDSRWLPGKLTTLIMDVSDQQSIKSARDAVGKCLGENGLHGLVNNAGIVCNGAPDDWLTVEDYEQALDINTYGVIRVCHAFKDLVKKCQGRIVTVASITARFPFTGQGPYSVSKCAISGYCDVIRQEMRTFGVKVCILEPGYFKTPMTNVQSIENRLEFLWNRLPKNIQDQYGRAYVEQGKEAIGKAINSISSEKTELVVDAYFHALTALFPRKRYHIGNDAKFCFIPLSMLPTDLQDWANALMMKWVNGPRPAAVLDKS